MTDMHIDEVRNLPSRPIERLNFQSNSEYACAKLLEKYTGWKGIEGVTFQIQVGRAVFDFRVEDTFIEYHPISLRREFITNGLRDIMSVAHKLKREDKLKVLEGISEELKAQYAKRRGQTLAAHPVYSRMELICVHSQEDFVNLVVKRFANRETPGAGHICQEFRNILKLKKASRVD
jgi:hypothetical protein